MVQRAMLVRLDPQPAALRRHLSRVATKLQENPMATKDTQSTQHDQGRQQGSEMGAAPSSHGQQGSGGAGQRTQQSGWQAPATGQQGSGAGMQARRAGIPTAPYYGAFGGSPFSMLRRMREDMDRLFDSFGSWRGVLPTEFGQVGLPGNANEGAWGLWSPHVDVREQDGKLIIAADLPGVRKDEVNGEITQARNQGTLTRDRIAATACRRITATLIARTSRSPG